eukprot:1385269-Prymnesium_polylepis.1
MYCHTPVRPRPCLRWSLPAPRALAFFPGQGHIARGLQDATVCSLLPRLRRCEGASSSSAPRSRAPRSSTLPQTAVGRLLSDSFSAAARQATLRPPAVPPRPSAERQGQSAACCAARSAMQGPVGAPSWQGPSSALSRLERSYNASASRSRRLTNPPGLADFVCDPDRYGEGSGGVQRRRNHLLRPKLRGVNLGGWM